MGAAVRTSHPRCTLLSYMLARLHNLEMQNNYLTEVAYGWCSIVCESHLSPETKMELLILALEIGFHHISPKSVRMEAELNHVESHQKIVDIIFQSGESEAIADLLCAWTSISISHDPHPSLKSCAEYLVGLSSQPFSPRLQQVIIWSIEFIGYQGFEQVGVEGLVQLLDGLHVCIKDMFSNDQWKELLLDTIQSPKGIHHVSHQYWELLVELVLDPWAVRGTISPHIMTSLEDTKEWDKLECWMGVIWILWSVGVNVVETDEELERITLSLFQQQPGAIHKLEQWVGTFAYSARQRSKSFQQMFDEVYLNAEKQAAL